MAGRGHQQLNKERCKLQLQISLLQAVIGNSKKAVKKAIEAFKFVPVTKNTGPGKLDFTCKQVNEALKNNDRDKLYLEGDLKKYMTYSPLMVALEKSPDLVQVLIKEGASVAFKNKDGLTALHVACNAGKLEMVDLLLKESRKQTRFIKKKKLQNDCQCFINAKFRPKGWTPLLYAVKNGHLDIVKCLIECEYLDCNVKNRKEQNVYHIAVRKGQMECLKLLCSVATGNPEKRQALITALKTSDRKHQNILHQACTQDSIEVKWLLEEFEELRTKEFLDQASKKGYTPFLVACEYYKKERTVKYFIDTLHKEGLVDISVRCHQKDGEDGLGTSALHLAALHNKGDLARVLVEAGCSLQTQDVEGNTILHVAMQRGNRTVAKFIVDTCKEKDIDLESVPNKEGKLPRDVEEEIVIPPEIRRMGAGAVAAYEKALEEGKRKIPYCGLLILGESEVGKTSLYRQLVGKEYRKDLERTKGIDNNDVDTMVDKRNVQNWHEIEGATKEFAKAVGQETQKRMPEKKKARPTDLPDEKKLLRIIDRIHKDLEPRPPPPPATLTSHYIPAPMHVQHVRPESLSSGITVSPAVRPVAPLSLSFSREQKAAPTPKAAALPSPEQEVRDKPKPSVPVPQPRNDTDQPDDTTPTLLPEQPVRVSSRPARTTSKQSANVEPSSILTHRDSNIIAGYVKGRTKHGTKEELTLIALDFAGHPEYRPMHHCFITRRACYLVVFKIPDMIKFINKCQGDDWCTNHWEEFRYWIHSINAHIYPPDKDEKKQMNLFRRIILVGTHRGCVAIEDLKKIDEFFKLNINDDRRCVNHVHIVKCKAYSEQEFLTKYFIAVENSIDIKNDDYLIRSGTAAVQEEIKSISDKLPFLKESYPIKWLKFKERIEAKSASTPVLSTIELLAMAEASRILEEDQQKLAIKFLHDSGRIVCLEYLPHLFLKDEERKELNGKVVIRPQWLISVMKEIMKLDTDEDNVGIDKNLVVEFTKSGKADLELLNMCWKQYLFKSEDPSDGVMELKHLCLLLKAYCLIFPLHEVDNESQEPIPNGDDITSRQNGSNSEVENIATGSTSEKKYPSLYLVPCKLPEKELKEEAPEREWFSFYFNFQGFLPAEVYHRLLCKLLLMADNTGNFFSRYVCVLQMSRKLWKIQYKQCEHMLEVSVVGSSDLKADFLTINCCLDQICCDSHLEGLIYVGSVSTSACARCPGERIVDCVKFEEGKYLVHHTVWCCNCRNDIGDLQDLFKVPKDEPDSLVWNMEIRTMDLLHLIKYSHSDKGPVKVLRILQELAPDWDKIGGMLGFNISEITAIRNAGASKTLDQCIQDVFSRWMQNPLKKYPNNWKGICQLLVDSKHGTAAEDLKAAIAAPYSDFKRSIEKARGPEVSVQSHCVPSQQAEPASQGAAAQSEVLEVPQTHSVGVVSKDNQAQQQSSQIQEQTPPQELTQQTKSDRSKMNKRQLASWLEKNGIDDEDIQNLKDQGVNENLFLRLKDGDKYTKDLSTATIDQIPILQEKLKAL